MSACMPVLNPHSASAAGQPGSGFTLTSDDPWLGPTQCGIVGGQSRVVCDVVDGTYISVMASFLNVPGGASPVEPLRYGSMGAKNDASDPVSDPLWAPAPAMTRSL